MKLYRKSLSCERASTLQDDIAMACDPGIDGRVCGPHCNIECSDCGAIACQCMCSQGCEKLLQMLSSEPDKFPIEVGIAPLVFELKATGMFTPCWSCEGHLNKDGKLWKLPQVWFYCESTVHLRLLADLLKNLHLRNCLGAGWTVAVTHSDPDNPEPTFAIQPHLSGQSLPSLASLQADAKAIACAIPEQLAAVAKSLKTNVQGSANT